MCGIVAIISREGPVSERSLQRGLASLRHRGPDGHGTWFSADRKAALGHVRLSIIDLETGAQPIASENEQLQIAVNGEFYGFERQRDALEAAGHRFRTKSDSEIALHLFEDQGISSVHDLRGEFAYTLWDERQRRLYAVRDRYGVKPLYYSQVGSTLYVASEIKALVACGVPVTWDFESVYLGSGLRGPHRTLFDGVFAVPPGHYLTFDEDGVRLEQYWDTHQFDSARGHEASAADISLDQWVRRLRRELEESVRLRLRADVPVACYLSGGLDSCAILGLASQLSTDSLRSFTLRFTDQRYDEGEIAAEMAAHVGAVHSELLVDSDDLADHFADAVFHSETTATNTHGVAKFLLSRSVRDAGYKVVMTGEGADELLLGYPHFRQDALLHANGGMPAAQRRKLLEKLRQENEISIGRLVAQEDASLPTQLRAACGFVPSWLNVQLTSLTTRGKPLNYALLAQHAHHDPAHLLLSDLPFSHRLKDLSVVERSAYLWIKTMLPNYILAALGDRSEMAHSVEGRLPFLDHEVGRLLHTAPVSAKIRGTVEKYLLREAVRDVVTDRVYRRQKHPFLSPPVELHQGSRFFELSQDMLRSDSARSIPFLNHERLLMVADQLSTATKAQTQELEPGLLYALSVVLLHQRFCQAQ